jgi:hypothetical protein
MGSFWTKEEEPPPAKPTEYIEDTQDTYEHYVDMFVESRIKKNNKSNKSSK